MDTMALKRFPSKRDALQKLRTLGVEFGCVVDVGVQGATDELIDVFPDIPHYLFEPVPHYQSAIQKRYENIQHEIFQVAVSDKDGVGQLTIRSSDGSGSITHSQLDLVGTAHPIRRPGSNLETISIPLVRLSSVILHHNFQSPILLKIDVDGHEPAIIAGLKGAEHTVDCIVVEAPLATVMSRCQTLGQMGFVLWDINDMCYYKGCLWQVDLIFLSSKLAALPAMQPLKTDSKIDWTAWQTFNEATHN